MFTTGETVGLAFWIIDDSFLVRFVPANPEPMTVYARRGVHVDKASSDARQITLENLDMSSMGRYRCEVSTEGPSFATVSNYGDMIVVGKTELFDPLGPTHT